MEKLVTKLTNKATPVILPEEIERTEFLGTYWFAALRH